MGDNEAEVPSRDSKIYDVAGVAKPLYGSAPENFASGYKVKFRFRKHISESRKGGETSKGKIIDNR
jgi:hypothetical protein